MDAIDTAQRVSAIALRPTLVATVVEDGAVLLDLDSKYFYRLNPSAWAILELIETAGADTETLLGRCRSWGASASDEASIREFLNRCVDEDIVEDAVPGITPDVHYAGPWQAPVMQRQAEPLQGLVTSAFDPSVPLAE